MISSSKSSSNIQFIFKKLHLVFVCFLYFPSLLVTFVFYISQLKFESCHRYMTGRLERIMLPGDVNNRKSAKTSRPSRLAGEVVFASIYVKYSMEVEGGFPRPYPSNFFFDANF